MSTTLLRDLEAAANIVEDYFDGEDETGEQYNALAARLRAAADRLREEMEYHAGQAEVGLDEYRAPHVAVLAALERINGAPAAREPSEPTITHHTRACPHSREGLCDCPKVPTKDPT